MWRLIADWILQKENVSGLALNQLMMASFPNGSTDEGRRAGVSPRPKGRENAKDTLCRNVTIYGHCRYEDKGCAFNHDPPKNQPTQNHAEGVKKKFNVDSPSFTPSSLAVASNGSPAKSSGLSPRAASAAPFKPRSLTPAASISSLSTSTTSSKPYNPNAPDWVAPEIPEFLPQTFNSLSADNNADYSSNELYSSYSDPTPTISSSGVDTQQQPYSFGNGANGFSQAPYLPPTTNHSQVLNHHNYFDLPAMDNSKPNQRTAKDMFLPEDLRVKLIKKTEATLRSFSNSQIPDVPPYHTLTPLEFINQNKAANTIVSTVYKAFSDDGKFYCLRRIHDFKVFKDSEAAQGIASLKTKWGPVENHSIVKVYMAFSTQIFGESSVIVVSDYHPDSSTLHERHLTSRPSSRGYNAQAPESLLWSYLTQIANALKAMHSVGLAARSMEASKWLVTDQGRIRFNGCGLADIVDPTTTSLVDQQRSDLYMFGQLLFSLGTFNAHNKTRTADHFTRAYSPRFRSAVEWLQRHNPAEEKGTIDDFLGMIATNVVEAFDASLHLNDILHFHMNRELENGRIARLLMKLNIINERPEYENGRAWSEQGSRTTVGLFRDYVFHQVDAHGNPDINMGHMIACLNKLDVGIDERITLTTRDGTTCIVVTYKEVKAMVDSAYQELFRRSTA